MRKRLIPFVLAVCALLLGMLPVNTFAAAPEGGVSPQAAAGMNGGLVYNAAEQAYYIVGECNGAQEYKTLVVALYKQSGGDWEFVDSAITCGSASRLTVKKKVSITKGSYKLIVSITTPTSSGSFPHFYEI
jgi:hypothetical protein